MKKMYWLLLLLPLILAGCVSTPVAKDAANLGVSFSFSDAHKCSGLSPAINLSGVPAGTASFKVKLVDLDKTSYNHGGGTVANNGSGVIPEGALRAGYKGPCPPSGSHRYKFTVYALDDKGTAIGVGEHTVTFP